MAKFNFDKFSKAYAVLNAKKNEIEADMKIIKAKLEEQVNLTENRKVDSKYALMYFKKGSTRRAVDLKKLEKDDPDLYKALDSKGYIKVTPINEAFTVDCRPVLIEDIK